MDLDAITIVTYVCAALGVLLLTLCIVLAFFVICGLCKKCITHQGQVYSVVPPTQDPLDIEHAVLQRYHINNDAMKGMIFDQGPHCRICRNFSRGCKNISGISEGERDPLNLTQTHKKSLKPQKTPLNKVS